MDVIGARWVLLFGAVCAVGLAWWGDLKRLDEGDFLEVQPDRARNTVTALGRMGGNVVGFVANNSAVSSGQVDIDAAYKNARFIRFCNLYNIPMMFLEDTTGFLPGREQESGGIVQAGRAMLDAIVDLRTPRFLVLVRNAFGGAYAAFNSIPVGADFVVALPTTRLAVMGPAGVEYVYKDELKRIRGAVKARLEDETRAQLDAGLSEQEATAAARQLVDDWVKAEEAERRQPCSAASSSAREQVWSKSFSTSRTSLQIPVWISRIDLINSCDILDLRIAGACSCRYGASGIKENVPLSRTWNSICGTTRRNRCRVCSASSTNQARQSTALRKSSLVQRILPE